MGDAVSVYMAKAASVFKHSMRITASGSMRAGGRRAGARAK